MKLKKVGWIAFPTWLIVIFLISLPLPDFLFNELAASFVFLYFGLVSLTCSFAADDINQDKLEDFQKAAFLSLAMSFLCMIFGLIIAFI